MRMMKKIVPYMLVLVMMITMLPTTASARGHDHGGHHSSGTNDNSTTIGDKIGGHIGEHVGNHLGEDVGNHVGTVVGNIINGILNHIFGNTGNNENNANSDNNENNTNSDDTSHPTIERDEDLTSIEEEEVPLAEVTVLNTEEHFAYLTGFEDGTIRPDATITRAEIAVIFYRLLSDDFRASCWTTENLFSDIEDDADYCTAVATIVNAGILSGYEDGIFKPEKELTRAEFAAIVACFIGESYEGDDLFTDIKDHWAAESINTITEFGWVESGDEFRPDELITRAEVVSIVNRMLGRTPSADHMLSYMNTWTDNMDTSAWYYADIQEATNSHGHKTTDDGEIWTELNQNKDWSTLEKIWAAEYSESNDYSLQLKRSYRIGRYDLF